MLEKVRIGFVGVGGIAHSHLGRLQEIEAAEIVGLCDVVQERVEEAAAQFGGAVFVDYERMLGEVEMDALYVCVPPFAHERAEILAAERGIHLFVEKPVVMRLGQGLEILEAVERAGILSSVGYSLRYTAPVQAARAFLGDRQIAMLSANRWSGIPGDENHWWRVYDKSGGQLLEQATHQVDAMRWFGGDIERVYGRYAQRVTGDLPNMTIPDVQVVTLEFASGAVGYIATCCALTQGGGVGGIKVALRDMVLEVGGNLNVIPDGAVEPIVLAESVEGIDAAFVRAVQTGAADAILCDYREGLKSAAACIAANESAASGEVVECWNG